MSKTFPVQTNKAYLIESEQDATVTSVDGVNIANIEEDRGQVTVVAPVNELVVSNDDAKVQTLIKKVQVLVGGQIRYAEIDGDNTFIGDNTFLGDVTFSGNVEGLPEGPAGPQGDPGPEGKSAYQIWLDEGGVGTEEDFLESLKGPKGDTGAAGADGATGPPGAPGPQGEPGESAYQIWLDAGNQGNEEAFLASLKGEKGDTGDTGEQGPPGADGAPGPQGDPGKSAYQYASEAGYGGTEEAFSKALLDSSTIVANYDHEKMMNWARAVCFSKTPYPEEFLIAEEATTEAEWRSLAPNSFAINGEDQAVYVEYHPKSEGGKNPWQMSPVAQRYYLVTKKSYASNAAWMCRGVYNFIWNLDSSVGALHLNALDLDLIKFWFVYIPYATYCDTLYNCIFGKNASVIIIAPKLTGANAGIILDPQKKIAPVSTKHYIRCYLPSLNTSCQVAAYHRAIASGVIFTLGSLPDVASNTTKPTITMGIDPDLVASTAEDGTMTFTDENLQTAVDNATDKGWTVAFNVTPYPETTTTTGTETTETGTSSDPSAIDAPSAYSVLSDSTSSSTTELWYHCELNEYGNYLNSDGDRVAITSATGFFGGATDGSWFKSTSESAVATHWNLTYSPIEENAV